MVLIDDEEWLVEMMELAIRKEFKNIDLKAFQDSKKAWLELAQRDPDILITGANMGELSGEEIVRRLIEQKVAYPILVMSGWAPAEKWVKSFVITKPNISFLQKPFTTEQLHAEISKLLGRDDKPTLNIIGLCPKCGMEVLEGSTGYFCRGKECGFKIAGVLLGQVLDSTQVAKLLRERRTDLLDKFVSKAGKTFSAFLVMDDSGKVTFEFPSQESELKSDSHDKDSQRKQSKSTDCKPLLDAATKDLYRNNAFRITGLPVDASTREVDRHAGKLKILAEFGPDPNTQGAAFAIKPPPSLDDIRDAIQKVKNPEKRLIDEFFWFWPEEFGKSQSDPAIQALAKGDSKTAIEIWNSKDKSTSDGIVASHNLALVYHIKALDWENYSIKNEIDAERRQKITNYWKEAFKRWERLATSEHFWDKVTARIRQLNEPNLPTGFARRIRATLPESLDKINAELAVAFAVSDKIEIARLHVGFLRGPEQRQDKIEKIAELVLTPVGNRLKEQTKSARDRGEKNPPEAAKVATELLQQSRQTLKLFDLFFGKDNELRNDLFDEVVSVCNRLQVVYHDATKDEKTCLDILNSILSLATAIDLRQQIEKNISTLKGFATDKKLEPIYALLKSIQDSKESPSARLGRFNVEVSNALISAIAGLSRGSDDYNQLWDSAAIVLRGISLDAWNNHQDRQTAVAANELAVKHATSPELKQRLAEDKRTLQQMRYEADLAPIASAPSLSTINGIGFKLYGATDKDSATGSYLSTYYFVFLFIPIFPICRYRVTSSGDSYRFFGKTPLRTCDKWHIAIVIGLIIWVIYICNSGDGGASGSQSSYTPPPAPSASSYTPTPVSASGNSDRNLDTVPSSVSSTLDVEKTAIETDRVALAALDAQVDKLGREIETDRLSLDQTSQSAIDSFNAKVDQYNTLVQKDKDATAAFNERVDNYNAKLRQ